jgi:hypothetical protein
MVLFLSHLLGSELSHMFQTCMCQRSGTRGGKSALTLDSPTGKILSIRLGMWQQTLALGEKRNSALSLYFHSVMLDCMLVCEVVLHQTGFMKTGWSDCGTSRTHMYKLNYSCHYWTDILWIGASQWNNAKDVYLTERLMRPAKMCSKHIQLFIFYLTYFERIQWESSVMT